MILISDITHSSNNGENTDQPRGYGIRTKSLKDLNITW